MLDLVIAPIVTIPIGRIGLRVNGGAALCLGRRQQCGVVFLRRLIWIGTENAFALQVGIAIAPGSRRRRLVANPALVPHLREFARCVAPVVVLVVPVVLIFVKVLRREEIDRQGL